MFLQLSHTKLAVFSESQKFALECYKITKLFPQDEKFALVQQIRRAATSVHLNLAEGSSRKSEVERKRYYEISRGSLIEVDSAIGIAYELGYVNQEQLKVLGDLIIKVFKMLTGMIKP
jgi:four helix bundle protein